MLLKCRRFPTLGFTYAGHFMELISTTGMQRVAPAIQREVVEAFRLFGRTRGDDKCEIFNS